MNKLQISILFLGVAALFSLFFFTDHHLKAKNDLRTPEIGIEQFSEITLNAKKALPQIYQDSLEMLKGNDLSTKKNLTISKIFHQHEYYGLAGLYFWKAYKNNNSLSDIHKGRWLYHQLSKTKHTELKQFLINKTEDIYTSLLKEDTSNLDAEFELANLYIYEKNQVMPGVQKLLNISKRNPDYFPAQYQLSILAIRSGQYEKAIKRLENLNKKEPDNIDVLLNLGKVYYLSGNKEKGNDLFHRCKSLAVEENKDMVNEYIRSITNA